MDCRGAAEENPGASRSIGSQKSRRLPFSCENSAKSYSSPSAKSLTGRRLQVQLLCSSNIRMTMSTNPAFNDRHLAVKTSRCCAAINVLGVKINAINMTRALEILDSILTNGQKGYVCVTGVHGVIEAQKDRL